MEDSIKRDFWLRVLFISLFMVSERKELKMVDA